jgi:cell division septal protein FtsQ
VYLGIFITLILVVIIALIILGIGWTNFFSAIMKGADKVKQIPVVRNITDTAQVEINKILNNVSTNAVNNIWN